MSSRDERWWCYPVRHVAVWIGRFEDAAGPLWCVWAHGVSGHRWIVGRFRRYGPAVRLRTRLIHEEMALRKRQFERSAS